MLLQVAYCGSVDGGESGLSDGSCLLLGHPLDVLLGRVDPGMCSRNLRQHMEIGEKSGVKVSRERVDAYNSPTLYATGEGYVIQGWIVSDPAIRALLNTPDDETIVEIPADLLNYLSLDGLDPEKRNLVPPIVHVKENGNYTEAYS